MLFLNTLQVNAASGSGTKSGSVTFTIYPVSGDTYATPTVFSYTYTDSGSRGSGSGTITYTSGSHQYYELDFSLPIDIYIPDYDSYSKYCWVYIGGLSVSSSLGSISNPYLEFEDRVNPPTFGVAKSQYLSYDNGSAIFDLKPIVHGHLSYARTNYNSVEPLNFTVYYSMSWGVGDTSEDFYNNTTKPTVDRGTHEKLDSLNETATTTSETTTSIFDSITDFFGSFFENIINALKSLFIPEDGYFTSWFDRLNTLLEQKLGMLYAPFGLVIDLLLAIMQADTSEGGIPIPELSIDIDGQTYVILQAQTFTFASLGERFNDLRDKVYFATDTVIIFAFLMLLQAKVRHIICDYESG